ncbi:MAG TPA: diacylglycerol kinase family protein [Vicinamibacterales bacterium]|nr:diacylglycerol kinase family protein [Vicinamibacterales bacterium]
MHVGIVINPISGRRGHHPGEADRRRTFAQSRADAAGVTATIVMTEARGHARELALGFVAARCDSVIAMGGDGTVNEVAQALVGTSIPLGILPSGSGDGLATGLGLTTDIERSMRTALTAEPVAIDVGYAGDRIFLNVAGVGFDGAVAHMFAGRSTRGALGYVGTGTRLVWSYAAPDYEVRWHTGDVEEIRRGPKLLLGFANGPTYGNLAVLSPDASLRDGLLDMVLVSAGGPIRQMWRARRLFWNHRRPAEGIERARIVRATISSDVLQGHLDGEPFETSGTLEFGVRPQALWVRPGRDDL